MKTMLEQGEGLSMIRELRYCWMKKYHYTVWNDLLGFGFFILQILIIIVGFLVYNDE